MYKNATVLDLETEYRRSTVQTESIKYTNTETNVKKYSEEQSTWSHVEHDWTCWLFHIKGYRNLLLQYLYPLRLDLMRAAAEFIKISPLHELPPPNLLKTTNSTFCSVFHVGLAFLRSVPIMPKLLLERYGKSCEVY